MICSGLNIQGFTCDGEWVKPENAGRVDVIVQSAGAGGTCQQRGADGERRLMSYDASALPDRMPIAVGRGGRGGSCGPGCAECYADDHRNDGSDGYVVVITSVPVS